MANITGTNGNDTLTGTASDDIIQGLGGNDLIIGSLGNNNIDGASGNDVIDGGSGNDVIDYTALSREIDFRLGDKESTIFNFSDNSRDTITNIETIIGARLKKINPNDSLIPANNSIDGSFLPNGTNLDIDLSKNQLTYFSGSSIKTLSIKNFSSITGSTGNNRLKGDDLDNTIVTGFNTDVTSGITYDYNQTIIGSKGNDILTGQNKNNDTLDYSNLERAETIKFAVYNFRVPVRGNPIFYTLNLNIDKEDFGKDKIGGFQKIIGATNKENTIEATSVVDELGNKNILGSLDVNLAINSLKINSPNINDLGFKNAQIEVVNFVNVIGGKNDDKIVGANKKGKLTGGGGNDTITGGNKNDIITGSDSTFRGVGEVDTLTGGGGRDKFVLGDKNGAYYVGKGKDDYALITDFNLFQDLIDLGGFKNYSFVSGGGNTIELYSGKDVNTRDLIAKIQLADSGSALRKAMITTTGTSSLLAKAATAGTDNIFSEINILSGASSIDETV
jgi:Ca2+-binding RTX toxin-like protein